MRKLLFVLFWLLSIHVFAQHDLWYSGAVVTSEDEVLTGEILFHPSYDVIVIRQKELTLVLPAHKINSFRYFDNDANINRKFTSLPDTEYLGQRKIYEIVVIGAILVLRKAASNYIATSSEAEGFTYYFLQNGTIANLRKFRHRLYPRIKECLSNEERKLHLNPNQRADAIKIIELYNNQFLQLVAL